MKEHIWRLREGEISRINGIDGRKMEAIKTKKFPSTYGSAMSWDYRYFGGGAWPKDGVVVYDRKTGELYEADTSPNSGPARGEFDPAGNYWAAGRGGSLIKFDINEKRVHEYPLPTPYTSLYTAKADKNGEVWAGSSMAGGISALIRRPNSSPPTRCLNLSAWIENPGSTIPPTQFLFGMSITMAGSYTFSLWTREHYERFADRGSRHWLASSKLEQLEDFMEEGMT